MEPPELADDDRALSARPPRSPRRSTGRAILGSADRALKVRPAARAGAVPSASPGADRPRNGPGNGRRCSSASARIAPSAAFEAAAANAEATGIAEPPCDKHVMMYHLLIDCIEGDRMLAYAAHAAASPGAAVAPHARADHRRAHRADRRGDDARRWTARAHSARPTIVDSIQLPPSRRRRPIRNRIRTRSPPSTDRHPPDRACPAADRPTLDLPDAHPPIADPMSAPAPQPRRYPPIPPRRSASGPRFATPDCGASPALSGLEASTGTRKRAAPPPDHRRARPGGRGRSPRPVDPAFLAAARRHLIASWRYKPATEDGRPVDSSTDVTLRFELE